MTISTIISSISSESGSSVSTSENTSTCTDIDLNFSIGKVSASAGCLCTYNAHWKSGIGNNSKLREWTYCNVTRDDTASAPSIIQFGTHEFLETISSMLDAFLLIPTKLIKIDLSKSIIYINYDILWYLYIYIYIYIYIYGGDIYSCIPLNRKKFLVAKRLIVW